MKMPGFSSNAAGYGSGKSRAGLLIAVVVIAIVSIFIMGAGSITGFAIFGNSCESQLKNLNVDLLQKEVSLNQTMASLNSCNNDLSGTQKTLSETSDNLTQTQSSLTSCASDLNTTKNDLSKARQDYSALQSELNVTAGFGNQMQQERDAIKQNYGDLSASAARDLCCVRKVFDSALTHYYIENSAIICTSDAAKTPFSCA